MKKLATLTTVAAFAIAIPAGIGAPAAFAQDLQYIGSSSVARTGLQGHVTYGKDCDAAFKGSTWCTSGMIMQGGPSAKAPDPDIAGEWINPVFAVVVDGKAAEISGASQLTTTGKYNCTGWADTGAASTGLSVRTNILNSDVELAFSYCTDLLKAACCK